MAELTPSQRLFWQTEQQKRQLMKQGYTKEQALKMIQKDLSAKLPDNMAVGIENGHICIRHLQPTNIGATLTKAFGGSEGALKMLNNIKKGFINAMGSKEESDVRDRHGDTQQEAGEKEDDSGENRQGAGTD